MPVNVNEIIRKLSPAERKKVEDRAAEIIAEEMSLRDLRKARKLTQARLAKVLGVTQDSVSRLEKRSDLLLSTLRKTVKAMGGDVRIIAEFPDRAPVVLYDLSEASPEEQILPPDGVVDYKTFKGMDEPLEQAATIQNVSNATDLFNCIQMPPFNHAKWAFRGQGDEDWHLRASIERVAKKRGIAEDYVEREFKRRAHHYLSDLPSHDDHLEWLALMQHHGAPTRLLDWTKSAYVAAFFAAESAGSQKPFAIWAIDQESVNAEALAMLGLNISGANHNLSSRENFERIYRNPDENFYVVAPVQPYRMNERLTIQQGLFFCPNNPLIGFSRCLKRLLDHAKERHGGKWVHKLVVKPEARLEVLEILNKMNINRATLFPGLDGFVKSIHIKTEIRDSRDWRDPLAS